MKHLLCILAAVAAITLNAGTGATIDWVTNYVTKAIAQSTAEIIAKSETVYSNGVSSATFTVDGCSVSFELEDSDVHCFISKDVTSIGLAQGLTNGVVWVENVSTSNFTSKAFDPIICNQNGTWSWKTNTANDDSIIEFKNTQSNLVFRAFRSLIQKSVANELK